MTTPNKTKAGGSMQTFDHAYQHPRLPGYRCAQCGVTAADHARAEQTTSGPRDAGEERIARRLARNKAFRDAIWIIQELPAPSAYPNWNSYCIRDKKTNVHIATVGNVDRYFEGQSKKHAELMVRAPEMAQEITRLRAENARLSLANIDANIDNARLREVNAELLSACKGIAWKIQAYGTHWEPSQAEREAISAAIARASCPACHRALHAKAEGRAE